MHEKKCNRYPACEEERERHPTLIPKAREPRGQEHEKDEESNHGV